VFYTRRLWQSFLAGVCILGCCLCFFVVYSSFVFTVYRFGSGFKSGVPGFVGRDSLSLFTAMAYGLCFLAFGRCVGILCCCDCIVFFPDYVPLWGCFLRNEIEEEGIVFKKKKLIK
jgi:hypothetical protein